MATTIQKHGMRFLFLGPELVSIDGEMSDVNLSVFHECVIEHMKPEQAEMLRQDTTHINLVCTSDVVHGEDAEFLSLDGDDEDDLPVPQQTPKNGWYEYDRVVREYLSILKNFLVVNVTPQRAPTKRRCCATCVVPMLRDEHSIVCPNCDTALSLSQMVHSNVSTINFSHEIRNFRDTIDQFEGQVDLPTSLYTETCQKLDVYLMGRGLPTGAVARKQPTRRDGTKKNTSRALMTLALKMVGFGSKSGLVAGNYVNHFLIAYWGWKKPDIALVRTTILSNHTRVLQVIGPVLATNGRKTNVGQWLMLCEHLRWVGLVYNEQYFKAHKTDDVVENHRDIMIQAFRLAGI